jgi:hypothetical protein
MEHTKKTKAPHKEAPKSRSTHISLYPLKPSEALRAFMRVDPKKVKESEKGR